MTDYETAGVRGQRAALGSIARHLEPTLGFPGVEVLTRFGHYASVLKVGDDLAIAISTDGVGSKTVVASTLGRYDTIGFDCVAMNANDILCVGARPVAMVDYIGVHSLDDHRMDEIVRGLGAAAKEAGIAIPGGETAQLPEVIGGGGDPAAFDLVGTCIGTMRPDSLVLGTAVEPGDAIIGIASSGIHSNGLTLARQILVDKAGYHLDDEIGRLGRTLGDELLEPTEIYVRAVTALGAEGIDCRGLVHITGDGLANLCRLDASVGYHIEHLPPAPEIFGLIQTAGDVTAAEMYRVFNMGVGFMVVTAAELADRAVAAIERAGYRAERIGTVTDDVETVSIEPAGLVGGLKNGESFFHT